MVGQEKGFFQELKTEYVILDDASARHAAFQGGQIDIMISSVDVFAQEVTQGIKGRIVLVTDESYGGDGIVAKKEIQTASDLRHKKIAFARATPSHYFLYRYLAKYGLTPSDVEQVVVQDPGNAGQAFLGGSVDAAVTFEPFLSQVADSGKGHILATTKEFPDTIVDVLIVSPQLEGKPDVLKRFIQGWLTSVAYIEAHQSEATSIIAKGLHVPETDANGMMQGLQFADGAANRRLICGNKGSDSPLAAIFHNAAGFWEQQGIVSNIPPANTVILPTVCNMPDSSVNTTAK